MCHLAHADLWAGAEVQLTTLLACLADVSDVEVSAVLLNEGQVANELRRIGIAVTVFSEQQHSSLNILVKLARYFRTNAPDIIHTHKYKDNILGAIAARFAGHAQVVRTIHGLIEPFVGLAYLRMILYEWVDWTTNICMVNKVIAVSSDILTSMRRRYPATKLACIQNGIDLRNVLVKKDKWEVRRLLGLSQEGGVLIGTVGRLTSVKGHVVLVQAAAILLNEGHEVKLLIVGDGPLRKHLNELVVRMGIEKHVIFAGHRDHVYDLIHAMDIFVLPSLHEGIPMVLLEALALERPVIASRVGGIPEVIEDKESGLLVTPGSVQELAQSLSTLVHDTSFAVALGKGGRRRVEKHFDARMKSEAVVQLYRSLVFNDPGS